MNDNDETDGLFGTYPGETLDEMKSRYEAMSPYERSEVKEEFIEFLKAFEEPTKPLVYVMFSQLLSDSRVDEMGVTRMLTPTFGPFTEVWLEKNDSGEMELVGSDFHDPRGDGSVEMRLASIDDDGFWLVSDGLENVRCDRVRFHTMGTHRDPVEREQSPPPQT